MFEPIYNLDVNYINSLYQGSSDHSIKYQFWSHLTRNKHKFIAERILRRVNDEYIYTYFNNMSSVTIFNKQQNSTVNLYAFWIIASEYSADISFLEKHVDKLHFRELSRNPYAIHLLEKYPEKINWCELLGNKNAIHLLENINIEEILTKISEDGSWYYKEKFYLNRNATKLIERHLENLIEDGRINNENEKKCLWVISKNEKLVPFLEKHPDLINWPWLSANPNAVHLLEKNIDKISWNQLCMNPNAMHLLEQNVDKILWRNLCTNPNAIQLFRKYYPKLKQTDIHCISFNTSDEFIPYIRENLHLVSQGYLALNPNVLKIVGKLNYEEMRSKCQPFAQELTTYVLNPARLLRICDSYNLDLEEYLELIND